MDLGEFRLARTLQHQAQAERKIDVIRQLLIQEPGFNSYQLFRALANGKDFISATDLTVFLHENNFVITKPDAMQLLARYSQQSNISYQDFFVNLELPDINIHDRGLGSPIKTAAVSQKVLLAHKMKTEVETNRNSTVLKELLAEELGSNFYSAFRSADSNRSGYLTIADIARILTKFSISLTEAELDCLVRKYDTNRDGRISYLEFLTQLMPEGRVAALRTPYSSPLRLTHSSSPVPVRSASRVTPSKHAEEREQHDYSRQQLSFDNVRDDDDDRLVPFNTSHLNVSGRSPSRLNDSARSNRVHEPVRSPQRGNSLNTSRALVQASSTPNSRQIVRSPEPAADITANARRQLEAEFEIMRQKLALHPSFTLLNAFKHLDSQNHGYISIGELKRCMGGAGYFCTPEELEMCIRLFDTNGDGKISYAEFISKMMPSEAVYSELVSSPSAGGIRAERRLSIPAQLDLARALKQRIDQEAQLDEISRRQMYSWSE
jgi:Ca2+-binding EF-hand superfamily protein